MRYFIEATLKIIEEEGAENLTIRKVSDLADYNSATLYNFFSSPDKLLAFSSLSYLKYYSNDLKNYLLTSIQTYYKIFPDDLEDFEAAKFRAMLIGETIESRTIQALQKPVREGFFDEADIGPISEVSILLFEGLLDQIRSGCCKKSLDEAVGSFVYHLETSLRPYLKK